MSSKNKSTVSKNPIPSPEALKEAKKRNKRKKRAAKAAKRLEKSENKLLATEMKELSLYGREVQGLKNSIAKLKNAGFRRPPPDILRYLRAILNPGDQRCWDTRIPDGFSRPTAVCHTYQTVPAQCNLASGTAGSDVGRFCYSFSPSMLGEAFSLNQPGVTGIGVPNFKLGSVVLQNSKVAYVNPANTWSPATSFQDPTPLYEFLLTKKGSDGKIPRLTKELCEEFFTEVRKPQIEAYCESSGITYDDFINNPGRHNVKFESFVRSKRKRKSLNPLAPPPVNPGDTSWLYVADIQATQLAGTVSNFYTDGLVDTYRPVAMSVWFECTLPSLINGGNVSGAYLPSDSLLGNVVPINYASSTPQDAVWTGQGPIENWENLANVPGAQNNKLGDGIYVFWKPESFQDIDFTPPGRLSEDDVPKIVISGQASGDGFESTSIPSVCGVFHIHTIYEYTTVSQVVSQKFGPYVPDALNCAKAVLRDVPSAMTNDDHEDVIAKAIEKFNSFYYVNMSNVGNSYLSGNQTAVKLI